MGKKLVITMTYEDEDNWRNCTKVQRVILPRELECLRAGSKPMIEAVAWGMYSQLKAAEGVND